MKKSSLFQGSSWLTLPATLVCVFALTSASPPFSDTAITNSSSVVVVGSNTLTIDKLPFRGMIAGQGNAAASDTSYSGIIGSRNVSRSKSSLTVGNDNKMVSTSNEVPTSDFVTSSAVVGTENILKANSTSSVVIGKTNTAQVDSSLIAGKGNDVEGPSADAELSFNSAAIGFQNVVASTTGWAIGESNTVGANRGTAIGIGGLADKADAVVIGKFNRSVVAGDALTVGAGTSATNRVTALRVTADGTVVLGKAQGDISMGSYAY